MSDNVCQPVTEYGSTVLVTCLTVAEHGRPAFLKLFFISITIK